ncbi:MAG: T9SS C-terminal target domain-containing protein [Bacteroidetes bacterium]|nr:MAG: T9SS C-terminal target domain-containing protein [Bacteroidota bacterium]
MFLSLLKTMKKHYFFLIFAFSAFFAETKAQIVNAYAKITAISGATLTLSNVDEANDTFEIGENIIIMQMQGNTLGDVSNSSTFGNLGTLGAVGRYEVREIQSIIETSGVPTSITLTMPPIAPYTTNANSSVQIISFPKLGNPNYTTPRNLQARNWDGNTGGVLAFEVSGTLTLAHSITADGAGFRGGTRSDNDGSGCDGSYFITSTNRTRNGAKGESIYKSTNLDYDYARGKILNGGGGGNVHNGGGGGGGSFKAGGAGGPGWNGSAAGCSPSAGGLGGISLEAFFSGSRVFMGGGGGGGQQNNTVGSSGGNGGGIILLKAQSIRTVGTCGITISANGVSSGDAGNDGVGGAGAGGSIVLQVDNWNIVGTCPVAVRANGGNGGSVNSSVHGGGGGGGQGFVAYSSTLPTFNITTTTNNGIGGCNDTGCSSRASNGEGANNAGIFSSLNTAMPMTLKHFQAELQEDKVKIHWQVVSYVPILYFEVEKTTDGIHWQAVKRLEARENSLAYECFDTADFWGTAYYRLKQVGLLQEVVYSHIVAVNRLLDAKQVILYPNPATKNTHIEFETAQSCVVRVVNALGQNVVVPCLHEDKKVTLDISNCAKGVYLVKIILKNQTIVKKLVVQ